MFLCNFNDNLMLKVICSASDKHSCNIKLKGLNPLLDLKNECGITYIQAIPQEFICDLRFIGKQYLIIKITCISRLFITRIPFYMLNSSTCISNILFCVLMVNGMLCYYLGKML